LNYILNKNAVFRH